MSQLIEKPAYMRKTWDERFLKIMKGAVLFSLMTALAWFVINMNASPSSAGVGCDCAVCHISSPHGSNPIGCSGCHDSPPQTGTHLVHYGSAPLDTFIYGDTGITSTNDAYRFGCGNCHPLDMTKHNNGTVEVELYNPLAPAGSLKAKNPSNAAYSSGLTTTTYASKKPFVIGNRSLSYSNGTCSNVYCHSGPAITSGPVSEPTGTDQYAPTYEPYTVTYMRAYKTTPAWGTNSDGQHSTFTVCTECHEFPLTTSFPSVQAGAGDSHQWVDDSGYGNLHAWNMGYDPISCRTCHYGTVTQANTWSYSSMDVAAYGAVPLASRRLHVNGSKDVLFDTTNPVLYNTTMSLNTATYDSGTKACTNVACHLQQTRVTWGSPYRLNNSTECNLCHRN
jgi:predicted CxxxxCH...CXXCH cytochrome family protein